MTKTPTQSNIIDIDLSVTKKKQFRFDGDDNRIIALNVSDMGIIARVSDAYPKLIALQKRASEVTLDVNMENDDNFEGVTTIANRLKEIDAEMRSLIDFMFDAPVCEKAAPDGSMYDPFNGSFRYEYIINLIVAQYESNLKAEFEKMSKQMAKHTSKYTKGK